MRPAGLALVRESSPFHVPKFVLGFEQVTFRARPGLMTAMYQLVFPLSLSPRPAR